LIGIFKSVPTRKGIKKAIEKGQVLVNDKKGKTGDWVQEKDQIKLADISDRAPKEYELKLEVMFEDDYLAIINKPAGISVSGNQFKTVQNALLFNLKKSKAEDALAWPKPVHRLDSSTSGLLVVAKSYKCMVELGRLFESKEIEKTYHAIVIGKPKLKAQLNDEIEEQIAATNYLLKETVQSLRNEFLSLLEVSPLTGRTHQIRIHLSGIGAPIFGDKIYGEKGEIYKGKGLFLASTGINLVHPVTKENVNIAIPIPNKFNSLMKREQRRWEKKHSKSH
jgi:RluA family pseudouridine synthase